MKLDDALIEFGVATDDIAKARSYQQKYGGMLEKLLVNMGSLSEDVLPELYAKVFDVPLLGAEQKNELETSEFSVSEHIQQRLNLTFLIHYGWLPVTIDESDKISFITKQPVCYEVSQYLDMGRWQYDFTVASVYDFDQLVSQLSLSEQSKDNSDNLSALEEDKLRELASEAPTVNFLNSLITRALKQKASDMHIEPIDGRYRVRLRIDGVLHDIETVPKRLELAVVSRLKILSGMDIAEKRRPQDGKIEMKIANVPLDIRVSILPLNEGESVVMRFLRKDSVTYDFSVLGLSADIEQNIRKDLTSTSGVILLTGPTGSGKTTTLYTFLNELNDEDVKIITLEDPVEYQLPGLNQVQVKPEIDFDFSAGLRSVVRQDPDIIMVGEIRDSETCRIAMQAALTGHLVFSTVHTNDAPSAFTRLIDLGVQEFLLNAGLIAIIAQRLARKLCPHCAQPHPESEALSKQYELKALGQRFGHTDLKLKQAVGCEQCEHTGYKGRFAVIEYLRCDDTIKTLPKDEQFIPKAKAHNSAMGLRTLMEDGLLKALQGETTIEEVVRVCG